MKNRLFLALAAVAFGLVFTGNTLAQEEESGYGEAQQAPAPEVDVSDEQLQQFVDAQGAISGIQQDFAGRLEGVEDPEEAQKLQGEANEAMVEAVEAAGLSVDQFNEIAMAIQGNPELQQRLSDMLGQ